jgi:hypothetical protein
MNGPPGGVRSLPPLRAGVAGPRVCGDCRARIRGEALERKWNEERAGRMASR